MYAIGTMPKSTKKRVPRRKRLDPSRVTDEVAKLRDDLESNVIGQPDALKALVRTYRLFLSGLSDPSKPVGNLLFLGPSGVGKTLAVETMAASITDRKALIKIDCAEYSHGHEIAKLVGSPPGYLGHRETPPLLTQANLDKYHTDNLKLSFVLFDEIEKANDTLWHLLLGILDKGTLTLGDNTSVDFTKTIIVMTSNLGAKEIAQLNVSIGFQTGVPQPSAAQVESAAMSAAKSKFSPEFLGRIDQVVTFRSLSREDLERILDLELSRVQGLVFFSPKIPGFRIAWTKAVKNYLIDIGTSSSYGARHLKHAIRKNITLPISNLALSGQINEDRILEVGFAPKENSVVFTSVEDGLRKFQKFQNPVSAVSDEEELDEQEPEFYQD